MPLHIDYRPNNFEDLFGNEEIVESLKTIINRKDKPHAYLFFGPSGCGKTTLARILSNLLGVSKWDYYEYNAANTRGIDTVREIAQNAILSPQLGDIKVYMIDECHAITKDGQNAILKLLEDTPPHVYLILGTTEPDRLLKTIRTRCTPFEVKKLSEPTIIKLLKSVLQKEGVDGYPGKILKEIAKVSDGCPRQALVLLDSVIDIEDDEKALAIVTASIMSESNSLELCRALLSDANWPTIRDIISSIQDEPEKIRYAILTYCMKVMLDPKAKAKVLMRCSELIDTFSETFIYSGKAGLINALFVSSPK